MEKQNAIDKFAVINFDFANEERTYYVEKSVYVKFSTSQMAYFKVYYDIEKFGDQSITISAELDKNEIFTRSDLDGGKNFVEFSALCEKGVSTLKIIIGSYTGIAVSNLKLEIKGYVNYANLDGSLSVGTIEDKNIISRLYGESAIVYEYQSQQSLKKIASFNSVYECSVVKVDNDFAYLLLVDKNRELNLVKINLTDYKTLKINLSVKAVMSACGYPNGNGGIIIYFSRLAEIYKGDYIEGSPFTYDKTGRKGVKLYAECNEPSAIIIVDHRKRAKLVIN
jgi:hypothetical protein